jgi:hypothetical protein
MPSPISRTMPIVGLAGGVAFDRADFFFEFEDDVAHVSGGSGLFKCFESGLDASIPKRCCRV